MQAVGSRVRTALDAALAHWLERALLERS